MNATSRAGMAALIALLGACSASDVEPPAAVLRAVRFVEVGEEPLSVTRRFSGTTAAEDQLPIAFRVAGQVREVRARRGDRVGQNAVLATLENDEYRLEVDRAQAGLESSRAQALAAESEYGRIRELYQNDSASRSQLEAAQANLELAQSNLVSAEAQLDRARLQLSYTTVRAPFSGEVSDRYVDAGTVVGAGQAVLALSGESVRRIQFSVPEDIVARVAVGTPATVSVDAAGLVSVPGEIIEVSSGNAAQGALFPVEVELLGPAADRLRPGMAATVDLQLDAGGAGRFVLAPHTVLEDVDGRHVFVVVPTPGSEPPAATVERRAVETGALTDAGIVIASGLAAGDRVVTAGMSSLRDGMAVRSPE